MPGRQTMKVLFSGSPRAGKSGKLSERVWLRLPVPLSVARRQMTIEC